MKVNGSLAFDASSASEIQNLRVEKVDTLPIWGSADKGRLIYAGDMLYYGTATSWQAVAAGAADGSVFSAVEGDAIETSLGAGINNDGTFHAAGFSNTAALTNPSSFTDAIQQIANYATANDTLAELNDVTLSAVGIGQSLEYDGAKWVNHTPVLADITNVTASAAELNELAGIGVVASDFTKLHAITASASEINVLDGVIATTSQLNFLAGVTPVTSSIQAQLNDKQPFDAGLSALATGGTGLVSMNGDTAAFRTLTAPAKGITIANGDGISGNPTLSLANGLASVEDLTTFGFVVQSVDDTFITRNLATASTDRVTVSNGDGIAGSPTIDLALVTNSGSGSFLKMASDAYGRVTGTTAVAASDITALVDATYVNVAGDTMAAAANLTFVGGGQVLGLPATPVGSTAAASKAYVDSMITGLTWKNAVHASSHTNVLISTPAAPSLGDSGHSLDVGERVLLIGQTAAEENGIYIFNGVGVALTRALDADTENELVSASVFVNYGTYANSGWIQSQPYLGTAFDAENGTSGSTPFSHQQWIQFSGGSTYLGGVGIDITGNSISVNLGAGIAQLPTDEVGLDVVAGKAVQLTSTALDGQLTFVLDSGSGLEQSAAGLKISAAGVSNTMLANSSITLDADDTGSAAVSLGGTLAILGDATSGVSTSIAAGGYKVVVGNATTTQLVVASFSASDFSVTAGSVSIATGGVDNVQLANAGITIAGTTGSDAVNLGETLTITGDSDAISTTVSANNLAIAARAATSSLRGVASFSAAQFGVTAGAVTIATSLGQGALTNVASSVDTATADDVLVYNGTSTKWENHTPAVVGGTINLGDLKDVGSALTSTAGKVLTTSAGSWEAKSVFYKEVFTASTSWTVNHSLGQQFVNVTVMVDNGNGTYDVVIPQSITMTTANQCIVTFNSAVAGAVAVSGVAGV